MNHEFKKITSEDLTRYVLEDGATVTTGAVATVPGALGSVKKRKDNILAQEKKETPKPRNFVAKNAKMGGAGQHKDKKKAAKQGDVKHKKPLAESYAEDLAKQVFDANPNIKDENAVLDAAWPIVVQDLGKKTAMSMFNYDEDFPSDLVSVYDWLQKNQQGVAEGYYDLNSDLPGMEPIDFSSNPSFKELVTRYTQLVYQGHTSETDPEEDQEHDEIEQYVAQHFGEKGSAHLQKAGEVSYWGRDDKPFGRDSRSSNLGRPNQPGGNFRTTKAGKMHGQDAKMMKAKVADRLGRHPEPNLPEGFNGEYDDEAGMAHSNLLTSARAVMGLLKTIKDRDNLPEWAQEKIAKAEMMLVGVWDYLQSQKEQGIDPKVEGFGRMRGSSSAYDRDYASSVSGMGRGPDHRGLGQELAHETNNIAISINGKVWKVVPGRGTADSREEANYLNGMKSWAEKKSAATGKKWSVSLTGANVSEDIAEVAPPGWEKTVKAMKKHDNIDNPFALAWSMKNKGYKSHKKESADPYFESLRAKVEKLAKK